MQDINVALALDDILTEIQAIKRFTKCQLVMSSCNVLLLEADFYSLSGSNNGLLEGKRSSGTATVTPG